MIITLNFIRQCLLLSKEVRIHELPVSNNSGMVFVAVHQMLNGQPYVVLAVAANPWFSDMHF